MMDLDIQSIHGENFERSFETSYHYTNVQVVPHDGDKRQWLSLRMFTKYVGI